jgi:WhiB family transcriptional regulator, redox-sensing transcriptional regulator
MNTLYIPAQRGGTPPRVDWREFAACRRADPALFFPVGTTPHAMAQADRAKRVCAECPVRAACLDWALATGQELGVWGGTAEGERRALRAARPLL